MKKREASFTTVFQKWAKRHISAPAVFEIKQTTTGSIPFSQVKRHQIAWLMAAIGESPATYKIPDVGSGAKPFDVIMVGFMDAYVVIKYPQACAIIGIEKWVGESRRSVRRSLTVARAREIAAYWCGDRLE